MDGAAGIWWVVAKDAVQPPTMQRGAPALKNGVDWGKARFICQKNLHIFLLIYSYLKYLNVIFALNVWS